MNRDTVGVVGAAAAARTDGSHDEQQPKEASHLVLLDGATLQCTRARSHSSACRIFEEAVSNAS
jgi:hypothetical protein